MAEMIKVKLPDGSVKEYPKGTTALEVAKSISQRLASAALVAETRPLSDGTQGAGDGAAVATATEPRLIDLSRPIRQDVELRILTEKDPEALEVFRHSSAHLMAAAVVELFPETKLGHGPATESGFFY